MEYQFSITKKRKKKYLKIFLWVGIKLDKKKNSGDSLYVIMSGCAEVVVDGGRVAKRFAAGDYFGEHALVTDNAIRRCGTVSELVSKSFVFIIRVSLL